MDIYKLTHLGILKTLWINFKVLPLSQAVRFPILLARNVRIGACGKGCISLPDGGKMQVGFHGYGGSVPQKSQLYIRGKIVLRGKGFHVFGLGTVIKIDRSGILDIGNNFSCHGGNTFLVNKSIVIGEDNMWSFDIVTMDTDAHMMFDGEGNFLNPKKEVRIGNGVWVGCRNTILKGASIPDGCVMGSGGIVTKKLEKSGSVYCGNRLVREGVIWSRKRNLEGTDPEEVYQKAISQNR